jgi:hypothetical protein
MLLNVSAPISIDELKKYFLDKNISYVINYKESKIQGKKLLTYLSNLEIPCDIDFTGCSEEEFFEILKEYFETHLLVEINQLETAAISCLLAKKKIIESEILSKFIEDNFDLLSQWESRLDSLTLYNLWTLNSDELKEWVESHPTDNADTSNYVNFVNVLKHEDFYQYYNNIDVSNLKNYKYIFNEYCFKGKNLYNYWSVKENPMFLLTWGIASGSFKNNEYSTAAKQDTEQFLCLEKQ